MDFIELAKDRYSVRKYKQENIPDSVLDKLLSVIKYAPTACNNQPQRIYVIKSAELREKLKKITPCTFDAPVILALAYDISKAAKGRIKPHYEFGETDTAIVGTHLQFAAQSLGLGTCWVGWFRGNEVSELLELPDNIQICGLMPVGYPAEDASPAEVHYKSRELEEMIQFL